MNINGLVRIPGSSQKKKYFFSFNGKSLLIYKNNAIPLEDYELKENIEIKSPDYKYIYLIGEEFSKIYFSHNNSCNILFFIHDDREFDKLKNEEYPSVRGLSHTIKIKVYFYIRNYNIANPLNIQKIQLSFPELNYFFHIRRGLEEPFDEVKRIPYEKNKRSFSFQFEKKEIKCELGVYSREWPNPRTPIELESSLFLSFEKTNDIDFIIKLYIIIHNLFSYLGHRKNINIKLINLYGEKNKRIISLADLHIHSNGAKENEKDVQKIVEYEDVKENLPKLIQLIAEQKVYIGHLCKKKSKSRTITTGRTIAVMSAFQSNIKTLYQNESKKSNDTLEENLKPKEKEPQKEKIGLILERMLDKFNDVLEPLISHLCTIKKIPVISSADISKSLIEQRNSYAHGDIIEKKNEYFILSFIVVEYLNYCMILSSAGYSKADIQKIIKKDFDF